MALFAPSESPAVVVKEIDLTSSVPNVQSSTGAIVMTSRWGPVDEPRLVANEQGLIDIYASPDDAHAIDFHNASYFLRYSNSLQVVRMCGTGATNAHSGDSNALALKIDNEDDFNASLASLDSDNVGVLAKYPGALGNSLKLETFAASDAGSTSDFASWPFKAFFDAAPGTSATATADGSTHDEVHVAVIDQDGLITGTKGEVLETYAYVSVAENAKNTDGTSNYLKDVINRQSRYIWIPDITQVGGANGLGNAAGTATSSGKNYGTGRTSQRQQISLTDGADGAALVNLGRLGLEVAQITDQVVHRPHFHGLLRVDDPAADAVRRRHARERGEAIELQVEGERRLPVPHREHVRRPAAHRRELEGELRHHLRRQRDRREHAGLDEVAARHRHERAGDELLGLLLLQRLHLVLEEARARLQDLLELGARVVEVLELRVGVDELVQLGACEVGLRLEDLAHLLCDIIWRAGGPCVSIYACTCKAWQRIISLSLSLSLSRAARVLGSGQGWARAPPASCRAPP